MRMLPQKAPTLPRAWRALGAGLALALAAAPAGAAEVLKVRVGTHPTFTRVVFELDEQAGYQLSTAGDGRSVTVTLDASSKGKTIHSRSPGVTSVVVEPGREAVAHIRLRKTGARLQEMILANPPRVVLDFVSEEPALARAKPAAKKPAAKPAKPKAAEVASAKPELPKPAAKPEVPRPTAKPEAARPATRPAVPTKTEAPAPSKAPKPVETARAPKPEAGKPEPVPLAPPKRESAPTQVAKRPTPAPKPAPKPEAAVPMPAPKPEAAVPVPAPKPEAAVPVPAPKPEAAAPLPAPKAEATAPAPAPMPEATAAAAPTPKPEAPAEGKQLAAGTRPGPEGLEGPPPAEEEPPGAEGPSPAEALVQGLHAPPAQQPPAPTPDQLRARAERHEAAPPPEVARTHPPAAPGATGPAWTDRLRDPVALGVAGGVVLVLLVLIFVVARRRRALPNDLDVAAIAEAEGRAEETSDEEELFAPGAPARKAKRAATQAPTTESIFDEEAGPEPAHMGDVPMTQATSDLPADRSAARPSPAAGGGDVARLIRDLERRVTQLESKLEDANEAREKLERQVAAQTEELRVQRAAIARTQRALRSLSRSDEEKATEPALREGDTQVKTRVNV